MNTHPHLEESLQRDIDTIRNKIVGMADLSQRALKAAVQALAERNRQAAYSVILRDQYIDELETELDRLCLEFLARQQPVAGHLRFVYAAIQINRELERIGDYAESIARQVVAVSALEPQPPYGEIVELGELTIRMLQDAVQAFMKQDADLAWRSMPLEERANTMRNSINAGMAELARQGRLPAAAIAPLMTVARRLERAADQAKNICEEVVYMCTGEFMKHKGGEAFRILFFDSANACLSQMAEGIGKAMNLPRFVFSSAGVAPQPLDPRAVEFMAGKGIDISKQTSKSLEQLPQWDHYQVLIVLEAQARDAWPDQPTKTICLQWEVKDPSTSDGPDGAVQAAFQSAYDSLDSNIRELAGAILEQPQPAIKL